MLYALFDVCSSDQFMSDEVLTTFPRSYIILQVVLCFKLDGGFVLCLLEFAEQQQSWKASSNFLTKG